MTAVNPTLVSESTPSRPALHELPVLRRWRRVPLVQQLRADDCGAACLAMVLAAHGVHGAAPECRELCDSGRDGTRVRTLLDAAGRFGLAAHARSLAPGDFGAVALPAIAHWESRHFVVVERWTPRRVRVVDPARGRRTLRADEFAASFSGSAITFAATADLVRRPAPRLPLWVHYLLAMFRDRSAQGSLAQVIAGSLLLQAAGLAAPLFTKLIVDDVAPQPSVLSLELIALAMSVVVAGKAVTSFVRTLVMIRLQTRLDGRLTEGFFDHLLRLPYQFFQGRSSGDLLLRLSSNTMIREVLTTQLLSVLLDGPFTLLYLGVLVVAAPSFALLVATLAVLQAGLVLATLRPLRDLGQQTVIAKSDEQSCLVELMKGITYIKAAGAERRAYERWVGLFRRQLGVFVERNYVAAKIDAALGVLRTASPLVLLWYGTWLVIHGAMPLGTMLALTTLAASFLTPVMSIVQNSQQLQMLEGYVERLADVLQATPEPEPAASRARGASRTITGRIDVRGLTYRFAPESPVVVSDVSFSVAAGATLGVVGPTGSGKSTILMLLLGLYRPEAGEVLYDGVSLSDLDPRAVRARCGVVLQDVTLFGGSIRNNITLGAKDATPTQLEEAARIAGLDADIGRAPMGYETRLAEGGSNLSGGQRQRIAIARAVLGRPRILLLDEASSHLDVASEARLNTALEEMRCTRIIVAHRLSAVRSADEILVMRHGRVVERGRHDALVRTGGLYAAIAAAQGTQARGAPRLGRHATGALCSTPPPGD